MDNLKDYTGITPESVLAVVQAMATEAKATTAEVKAMFAASRKELEQSLKKSRAEFEQSLKQSRAEAEKRNAEFEQSLKQSRAEFNQSLKQSRAEAKKRNAEFEQSLKQSRAEAEKDYKAMQEQTKQIKQMIGGMANSTGDHAEEFFYNALRHGRKNLFGEKFDDVQKGNKVSINKGYEDEYDILLVNGRAVCVVEVKYKADSGDLPQRVLRKAQTFRVNFPQHKDKKVYLALASMSFNKLTEKACADSGIAIMKQVGDTMVVSDANLKTF